MLTEDPFEGETEAFGGLLRRSIRVIAFPLEPTETGGEGKIGAEVQRLGGRPSPRQCRAPEDVPDLHDAVGRIDAHQRLPALGPTGGSVHDGEEEGIGGVGRLGDPGIEIPAFGLRRLGQVSEPIVDPRCGRHRGEEAIAVIGRIERFEVDIPTMDRLSPRRLCAPEIREVVVHG